MNSGARLPKCHYCFHGKNFNFVLLSVKRLSANPIPECIAFFLQKKEELQ